MIFLFLREAKFPQPVSADRLVSHLTSLTRLRKADVAAELFGVLKLATRGPPKHSDGGSHSDSFQIRWTDKETHKKSN
jgi:hypothetical protein